MGQVHHGSATTTAAVRRAIQHSQESLRALAKRYGINQKTVAKWKGRTSVADVPTGPKNPTSTVLTIEEEAVIVAFRQHTLLPLDDCLYALQPTIPSLTRSSLHRCLQRHGISRLPEIEGETTAKTKFKSYPIGFFHIDLAEVRTAEGRLYTFVAIDRTSKFAFVELHRETRQRTAADFLRRLIEAVPYKVHTVLIDNGIHFTTPGAGVSAVPLIPPARLGGRPRTTDMRDVMEAIRFRHPWLRHVFADGGYAGDKLKDVMRGHGRWTIGIVKRSDAAKGFVLLPRRWVVERTFAWLGRCRRLAKDWEKSLESATAFAHMPAFACSRAASQGIGATYELLNRALRHSDHWEMCVAPSGDIQSRYSQLTKRRRPSGARLSLHDWGPFAFCSKSSSTSQPCHCPLKRYNLSQRQKLEWLDIGAHYKTALSWINDQGGTA